MQKRGARILPRAQALGADEVQPRRIVGQRKKNAATPRDGLRGIKRSASGIFTVAQVFSNEMKNRREARF